MLADAEMITALQRAAEHGGSATRLHFVLKTRRTSSELSISPLSSLNPLTPGCGPLETSFFPPFPPCPTPPLP